MGNRKIAVFDIRQTGKGCHREVQVDAEGSLPLPIHSLYSHGRGRVVGATMQGVFSGSLLTNLSSSSDTLTASGLLTKSLSIPGSCASLHLHSPAQHLLSVFRQADAKASARAALFTINVTINEEEFKVVRSFESASPCTRLTGTCLFGESEDRLTAALIDESSAGVHLWNMADGCLRDSLAANTHHPILDVGHLPIGGSNGMIMTLSEQQLFLYK